MEGDGKNLIKYRLSLEPAKRKIDKREESV